VRCPCAGPNSMDLGGPVASCRSALDSEKDPKFRGVNHVSRLPVLMVVGFFICLPLHSGIDLLLPHFESMPFHLVSR